MIFENGDAVRRAREVASIFTTKAPFWKQLYLFTEARIGADLANATSRYPVTEISGMSVPELIRRHRETKQRSPAAVSRLESIVPDPSAREQLIESAAHEIPFAALSGVYKRLVFRDYLRRSIEASRSPEQKMLTDGKNRALATEQLVISPGSYAHGSNVDHLDQVLLNGNLPGEALGELAKTDGFPFQVDFARLSAEFITENTSGTNTAKVFENSIAGGYGTTGKHGQAGKIYYLYDRTADSWEAGKEYSGRGDYHALMLGGVPSTEIRALVITSPETSLAECKKKIVEGGQYIAVYGLSGELLFTPQDYDAMVTDRNLRVPVEVWDYSLKTGGQRGSNPGGEFTVPTERGPVKYYVKFGSEQGEDQLWNEQLADNFYRHLGLAVPDTKIVKVEGSYGHASEILPLDGSQCEDLKNGFVADALLANWDIVYNAQNALAVQGKTYRLDNGGALLFRARGERKGEDFGREVRELGVGEERQRLGKGMRQEYPGLAKADIEKQTRVLRRELTDEAIDDVVDSVRLAAADRQQLKTLLRQRRDYIIEQVLGR